MLAQVFPLILLFTDSSSDAKIRKLSFTRAYLKALRSGGKKTFYVKSKREGLKTVVEQLTLLAKGSLDNHF